MKNFINFSTQISKTAAYPMEMSNWMVANHLHSYSHDILGLSFITLFPWITTENIEDNSTVLTFDILNPHPYKMAEVNISYLSEVDGSFTEISDGIAPYTHRKVINDFNYRKTLNKLFQN